MPKCTVYKNYCSVHEFRHGAEAEELREGIENLLKDSDCFDKNKANKYWIGKLRDLLESVDARDSVAYLEAKDD